MKTQKPSMLQFKEEVCYTMVVLWELMFVLGGLKLLGAVSSMQRGEETENVPE